MNKVANKQPLLCSPAWYNLPGCLSCRGLITLLGRLPQGTDGHYLSCQSIPAKSLWDGCTFLPKVIPSKGFTEVQGQKPLSRADKSAWLGGWCKYTVHFDSYSVLQEGSPPKKILLTVLQNDLILPYASSPLQNSNKSCSFIGVKKMSYSNAKFSL